MTVNSINLKGVYESKYVHPKTGEIVKGSRYFRKWNFKERTTNVFGGREMDV
jgi:hypothetical protein